MKKFLNTKCVDMTVGQCAKFIMLLTAVFTATYLGIWWMVIKIDKIISVIDFGWNKVKSIFSRKKTWVTEEEEEL